MWTENVWLKKKKKAQGRFCRALRQPRDAITANRGRKISREVARREAQFMCGLCCTLLLARCANCQLVYESVDVLSCGSVCDCGLGKLNRHRDLASGEVLEGPGALKTASYQSLKYQLYCQSLRTKLSSVKITTYSYKVMLSCRHLLVQRVVITPLCPI